MRVAHGGPVPEADYVFTGGISDELRERISNYPARLTATLSVNPDRVELTFLFLREGSYMNPGFQWGEFECPTIRELWAHS
jgi:hypothetical protein